MEHDDKDMIIRTWVPVQQNHCSVIGVNIQEQQKEKLACTGGSLWIRFWIWTWAQTSLKTVSKISSAGLKVRVCVFSKKTTDVHVNIDQPWKG